MFPKTRPRRLRRSEEVRSMVKETHLRPADLIAPYFVVSGKNVRRSIASMPGHAQLSIDQLLNDLSVPVKLGIKAILLFGLPAKKDPQGRDAYSNQGVIQGALRAIKKKYPTLIVMTDLCFCEYTTHGHCGIVMKTKKGGWELDNDATLSIIGKTAVVQARAGADFVAPSGMIDGAVSVIRVALDKAGYKRTGILAYSAKYASAFYGPFREAVESSPVFGDRTTYQMDPANHREALREILEDIVEGADMVMVKPALSYLDVLAKARSELKFRVPLVAYNVSGEYAMVKAAEKMGWLDGPRAAMEILMSIKRAGADLIITYHAVEVARQLKSKL